MLDQANLLSLKYPFAVTLPLASAKGTRCKPASIPLKYFGFTNK